MDNQTKETMLKELQKLLILLGDGDDLFLPSLFEEQDTLKKLKKMISETHSLDKYYVPTIQELDKNLTIHHNSSKDCVEFVFLIPFVDKLSDIHVHFNYYFCSRSLEITSFYRL